MRALRRIAAVFLALSGIVVVGSIFLPALNAPYAGSARLMARPWVLDAAGLVWMFALWGALVALMVFLIGWIAEGMDSAANDLEASPSLRLLERPPASGPAKSEQAEGRTRGGSSTKSKLSVPLTKEPSTNWATCWREIPTRPAAEGARN